MAELDDDREGIEPEALDEDAGDPAAAFDALRRTIDLVSAFPASLQAGGALSCIATRKCALLNSIATLFRRSVWRLRQGRCDELRPSLCCTAAKNSR